MKKVSDYIYDYLKGIGVSTVFTLTGGGIMHLVDSLGHSGMEYVCCHHEQAAAIAAQAYGMYQEQLCVCLVTTGPGGTNALTGTAAAYMDSTPVIYMSGQVKRSDFALLRGVRQFGAQENDIIAMAEPVTKYAVMVTEPEEIAYELEKCIYMASHGRKGPVWIDIPLDVQAALIDETGLRHFQIENQACGNAEIGDGNQACGNIEMPAESQVCGNAEIEAESQAYGIEKIQAYARTTKIHMEKRVLSAVDLKQSAQLTIQLLRDALRPVLLVGQGMISSGAAGLVRQFVEMTGIPTLATWRALDFMGSDEECFFGSPGLQAPRYSNLIVQYADVLLVLGSRMDNMITAFNEEHFAFRAKKIVVDIDKNEIQKLAMTKVTPVVSDVKEYMQAVLDEIARLKTNASQIENTKADSRKPVDQKFAPDYSRWRSKCRKLKKEFPILSEKQDREEGISLYQVTEEISRHAAADDTIVISSTSRCNTAGHIAFEHKRGQKTISSMGMGSMGFALPSAVGAYYANGRKRVVMIEGDGSFQLNLQELQTVVSHQVDVKMFLFENRGYAAITSMQDRNFGSFYVGSNEWSGVTMPDLKKISDAYGIPYLKISRQEEIAQKVKTAMEMDGPVICAIQGSLWFDEIPKCISSIDEKTGRRVSACLENPYPFLSEEKLREIESDLLEIC